MENMRELFHKCLGRNYVYYEQFHGNYVDTGIQKRWEDWQAAWKARQEFDAKLCEEQVGKTSDDGSFLADVIRDHD